MENQEFEKIIKIIEEDIGVKVRLTFDSYKSILDILNSKKTITEDIDILKIRRELKLTQTQFAEKIGVKRGTIALVETGRNGISHKLRTKILNFIHKNNGNESKTK